MFKSQQLLYAMALTAVLSVFVGCFVLIEAQNTRLGNRLDRLDRGFYDWYNPRSPATLDWNFFQSSQKCCGMNDPRDWFMRQPVGQQSDNQFMIDQDSNNQIPLQPQIPIYGPDGPTGRPRYGPNDGQYRPGSPGQRPQPGGAGGGYPNPGLEPTLPRYGPEQTPPRYGPMPGTGLEPNRPRYGPETDARPPVPAGGYNPAGNPPRPPFQSDQQQQHQQQQYRPAQQRQQFPTNILPVSCCRNEICTDSICYCEASSPTVHRIGCRQLIEHLKHALDYLAALVILLGLGLAGLLIIYTQICVQIETNEAGDLRVVEGERKEDSVRRHIDSDLSNEQIPVGFKATP